jgi:hypothetical protein
LISTLASHIMKNDKNLCVMKNQISNSRIDFFVLINL